MIDPEYEKLYLSRIAELVTGYEKKLADLRIENAHLKHAFELSEQMRNTPPAEPPAEEVETLDGAGTI